jgi:hypothetical protein
VTLLAHHLAPDAALPVRQAAWYPKATPTLLDAVALVRQHLWAHLTLRTSSTEIDVVKVPRSLVDHWSELLSYAA